MALQFKIVKQTASVVQALSLVAFDVDCENVTSKNMTSTVIWLGSSALDVLTYKARCIFLVTSVAQQLISTACHPVGGHNWRIASCLLSGSHCRYGLSKSEREKELILKLNDIMALAYVSNLGKLGQEGGQ